MKNETQIQLITKSDRNGIVPTVKWYRLAAEQGNEEAREDLMELNPGVTEEGRVFS